MQYTKSIQEKYLTRSLSSIKMRAVKLFKKVSFTIGSRTSAVLKLQVDGTKFPFVFYTNIEVCVVMSW